MVVDLQSMKNQSSINIQKDPTLNNKGIIKKKMHEQGKVGRIWAKGDSFMQ